MEQVRRSLRLTGSVLVVASWLAVVAGLALPWSWRVWPTDGRPGPLLAAGIALLGPAASALRAVGWWRPQVLPPRLAGRPTGVTLATSAGAAVAGGLAAVAASQVSPAEGIRAGGPLAVVGCVGLSLGWLLTALSGTGRTRWAAAPAAAGVALVLGVGVATVDAIQWYSVRRFDHPNPMAALPDAVVEPPANLDRERWRAEVSTTGWPTLAGRYLIVTQPGGVDAIDAITSQPRWSYRRTDLTVATGGIAADATITVIAYTGDQTTLAVGLETSTGRPRWQHWYPNQHAGQWRLVHPIDGGHLVIAGDVVVGAPATPAGSRAGARLTAIDLTTGAPRWSWRSPAGSSSDGSSSDGYSSDGSGDGCVFTDLAMAGQTLAVAVRCARDNTVTGTVVGLSAVDGTARWEWRPADSAPVPELSLRPAGDRFLVGYATTTQTVGVVLDAASGAAGARHVVPAAPALVAVAGRTALYLAGTNALSVDLASGVTRWSRNAPEFGGWAPLAATDLAGTQYLLLRGGSPEDGRGTAGGLLRLVALNLSTGEVRADRVYPLLSPGCEATDIGRLRCEQRQATMWLAPGLLVVAERPVAAQKLRIGALG